MSDQSDKPITDVSTIFKHEVIKEVLRSNFTNPKNKITDEAVSLVSELAKLMVIEAALRSASIAKQENRQMVILDNVETILPQLILDFP